MMFSGAGEDVDNTAHEGNIMPAFTLVENGTEDKYYKKYNAILRRCSSIQKENEMLVNRVYQVKKIVRRLRKERKFLMEELDKRGDNYRSLPLTIAIEEEEKSFALPQTSSLPALGRPRSTSSSSSVKRQLQVKREKPERDPTAPKRPSNAFLQFCQEQRDTTTAQYLQQTGRPLDKKHLTKLLAARWSSLSEDDKKVRNSLSNISCPHRD
ncbi:TCF3 fusion partner-like, partial [Homarus americanus]